MEIHDRMRLIRQENNLTQSEFGDRLGISRDVYANIENNRLKKPETKDPIIKLICKEFNISEEWLKTGNGEKSSIDDEYTKAVVKIDQGDPRARQAILDYWHLTEEDKALFWNFVERFLKKNSEQPLAIHTKF